MQAKNEFDTRTKMSQVGSIPTVDTDRRFGQISPLTPRQGLETALGRLEEESINVEAAEDKIKELVEQVCLLLRTIFALASVFLFCDFVSRHRSTFCTCATTTQLVKLKWCPTSK